MAMVNSIADSRGRLIRHGASVLPALCRDSDMMAVRLELCAGLSPLYGLSAGEQVVVALTTPFLTSCLHEWSSEFTSFLTLQCKSA